MKKFVFIFLYVAISTATGAQQLLPLPIDKNVRYGKLENGLTYIIRHNEKPKNRAGFYIAQKVGSILEEEDQRGLAHFLEHMAFNGSEHFPKKGMLNYLERNGVKFGTDLNAYTSFDQTVYKIDNVPVNRAGLTDSCLYILYDWSAAISLEDDEIDNERGVINEEWRTRNNAYMRMFENNLPIIMKGSKYAERMPIGSMDVVMNFSYKTLRDYYKKWYRPDLQGIIIVGDINVDSVEHKIKTIFGGVKLSKEASERTLFQVPDNKEPLIAITSDKEAPATYVSIYCKHKTLPPAVKSTILGLTNLYKKEAICYVLNERLKELSQKPGSPIIEAECDDNNMIANTIDAFMVEAAVKEGKSSDAIKLLATEIERLKRHGITAGEYNRARAEILSSYEKIYNERDKRDNNSYIDEYVDFFLAGGSIMGIEKEFEAIKQIAEESDLNSINSYINAIIGKDNRIVTINGIEKDGLSYPLETEISAILDNVETSLIEAYTDNLSSNELIEKEPQQGRILKTKTDNKLGTTTFELSNGAKVVLKPTDFKDDQIIVNGVSKGGELLYGDTDVYNTKCFDDVIGISRLGNFSRIELQKILAGKQVSVSLGLNDGYESVRGLSTVNEIETLMKLIYLSMTNVSVDKEAFSAWKERTKEQLKNLSVYPKQALSDTLSKALYKGNLHKMDMKESDVDKVDYDRIMEIHKERYGNAGDFTFTFVGNVNTDSIKPLIEKYIASLPAAKKREKAGKDNIGVLLDNYTNNFEREMQNISGTVYLVYTGKCKYTTENALKLKMFKQIMDIVYVATIREEEGGTYGVGTSATIYRDNGEWIFLIGFDTNTDKMQTLKERAITELEKVIADGPSEATFDKVKEYLLKKENDDMHENGYWLRNLNNLPLYGKTDILKYRNMIEQQSAEGIKAFAEKLFSKSNLLEVTMKGVHATAE